MKQIEISDNYNARKDGKLWQTFYIDNSQPFPYYRPLYLVVSNDEKQAAKSGKNQYFLDHMTEIKQSEWKAKIKDIKVIARPANKEKDEQIKGYVNQFNDAKNVTNRNVCEIMHREAEEKIHELVLKY